MGIVKNVSLESFCHKRVKQFYEMFDLVLSRIFLLFQDRVFIHEGSQLDCNGPIEANRAQQICEQLNGQHIQGVFFNKRTIAPVIRGGTCSAMTFDNIDQFLKRKTGHNSSYHVLRKIAPRYTASSQEFKIRQAAFNTISKHPQETSPDFKRDKIAAMLKLFQRRVGYCSEEIQIDDHDSYSKILKTIKNLPHGAFVVRTLAYENNIKEERDGHSLAFFNQIDGQFVYDPNHGTFQLNSSHSPKKLHELLKEVNDNFRVPSIRFYQVL